MHEALPTGCEGSGSTASSLSLSIVFDVPLRERHKVQYPWITDVMAGPYVIYSSFSGIGTLNPLSVTDTMQYKATR
jgi:hypothetical protein